jgi:hypothetical protein
MPSIHDSLLTGYVVDGTRRSITLHTEPHAGGGEAFIDVVFRGVVAYDFEGDCFQNIVFGIDEVPVESIIGDGELFVERFRQCAWPRDWNPNVESIGQFFERVGAKLFELHSSYGIAGWIAASSMEHVVLKQPG